jgi:thymidylate kinase
MIANKKINFYEFAGLPGSGKSSLCQKISDSYKIKPHKSLSFFFTLRFRFIFSFLISPIVILKYSKIFGVLLGLKNEDYTFRSSLRVFLSILSTLGDFLLKKNLSQLESFLRGKRSLLDEGFIQCGLSIWLRSPPEIQNKIWETFLQYMPRKTLFILIDLDYELSLRRSLKRKKGIPAVIQSRPWANSSYAYLENQFFQLFHLLKDEKIRENENFFFISSSESLEITSTELIMCLSRSTSPKNLIIN